MRPWLGTAVAALFLGLAAAALAGGPPPPVAAVVLPTPAQITRLPGGALQRAQALEAWGYVDTEPGGYLAVSLGPEGEPVKGRWLARRAQPGWPVLWLFQPQGMPGPWWVPPRAVLGPDPPQVGGWGRVGLKVMARIPAQAAALVTGPAALHARRLAQLREANLPLQLKRRLAAGRLEKGDNFWWVELAWGKPQRSFMVNYINDEQHYVYLRPGGPVLLRFVGGRLQQVPLSAGPEGVNVATPSTHR